MSDKDKIDAGQGADDTEKSPKNPPNVSESDSTDLAAADSAPYPATAIEAQMASAGDSGEPPPAGGSDTRAATAAPSGGGLMRWLLWALLVLILGGLLTLGLLMAQRQLEQQNEQTTSRIETLQHQLVRTQEQLAAAGDAQQRQAEAQSQQQRNLVARLDQMEQALNHQGSRLRALSTTTREDWLLAEAEYLLKLANQRLLIERSTEAAEGLLEQADAILRDLDDPQLTPLRRAVTRDLTELKLATEIDLEGLYLRLASLAESVPGLPTMPARPQQVSTGTASTDTPASPEPEPAVDGTWWQSVTQHLGGWWQAASSQVSGLFTDLNGFIRVRDHAQRPAALLPPDAAAYLQQNLRMMLEQAQLAAMREQVDIYQRSLGNVQQWAKQFYPPSAQLNQFLAEVQALAEADVQPELPDISESLEVIHNYIDRLHKLKEVDDPETDASADAVAPRVGNKQSTQKLAEIQP